ncbi:MAG: glutamine-hydrolyzing GMP synthase [Alphaproteobacteria bacterium]|nr:MAG: glutamine-hydrolyzing GMP synthase [Alphaproteobacteria bacterium]
MSAKAVKSAAVTPLRKTHDTVVILDFGSQVTQLIARRVREIGVYSVLLPFNAPMADILKLNPKAIILSGGPASVTEKDSPRAHEEIFSLGIPVLGICYGLQTMCEQLGGKVMSSPKREFGRAHLTVDASPSPLFAGIWGKSARPVVWMSHGDSVSKLPAGFKTIGKSDTCAHAAVADEKRKLYGVQFHPEVVHTPEGKQIISNFILNIAGCRNDWTMDAFKDEAIEAIRKQVGKERVICGVSGGVDSTVVAGLLHAAIGDQLTCIFVDTGLMRLNESEEVVGLFRDHFNIPLIHEKSGDLFISRLKGVSDPEQKRKIIGKTFIDVFEGAKKKAGEAAFLAQGTLYPDVIESVSFSGAPTHTIKSHHNVGGLPKDMKFKLVEPLRSLFKDEVRALGLALGIPEKFIKRHPFPGPGLAIRIPGDITEEKLDILRRADAIFIEELHSAKLYDATWQAFAVLLPVKTVGVMGDGRTYDSVLALRAVTSVDGMTADYADLPHEFLGRVAVRLVNEVKGINRVVYDITSKPPGTIEWE